MFFLSDHQDVFEPLCSFRALIRKLTYMGSRAKDKNGEDFTITQKKEKKVTLSSESSIRMMVKT